ncbi:MAG: RES family NAD+ phosphorylase [Gemmatimonadales bacterium]
MLTDRTASYVGRVWRYVPRNGHPLNVGYILRASGRWNRAGEYGCLYTSLSADGCRAEYFRYLEALNLRPEDDAPRDVASIRVRVSGVLDLTSRSVRARVARKLALSETIPTKRLRGDDPVDLALCLAIADWARAEGYVAIISPSAASRETKNLNIFIDIAGPDRLRLDAGSDREALNY